MPQPVVIVSGSVREALFAQPLVAALEGASVFAPREGLSVLRLDTVGRGFAIPAGARAVGAWPRLRGLEATMVVVPPPVSAAGAALAYFSGVGRRVAVAGGGDWWATDRVTVPTDLHPVDVIKRLAASILPGQPPPSGPHLEPGSASLERLEARLRAAGVVPEDRVLLAIPGRGNWVRRVARPLWPAERFAVLANQLGPDLVAVVRGAGDATPVREMLAGVPTRSVVIDLQAVAPAELAALARRSVGVIGHDGDALHVAAAAGGRTLALLAAGDLAPYGPDGEAVRVDAPDAVPALQVLEAGRRLLGDPTHA
jgi:ADP-heptose:LPS heptosyltransferase